MFTNQCARCGRTLTSGRRFQRHMRLPCAEDTVVARRRRAAEERAGGVPIRPITRGRKLMMR